MKITVYRPHERFNKLSVYEIFIGSKKLTELRNGEEKTVDISESSETITIQAKIHWCGSKNVLISKSGENVVLRITGNEFLNMVVPLMGGLLPMAGLFFSGSGVTKTISIAIMIIILAGLVSTLTVWRNLWLRMEIVGMR